MRLGTPGDFTVHVEQIASGRSVVADAKVSGVLRTAISSKKDPVVDHPGTCGPSVPYRN